jgi:hypothetical protein
MHLPRRRLLLIAVAAAAYGHGPTEPPPAADCTGVTPLALGPGDHAVVDPAAVSGCLRLPAAGIAGAEYLVVALSANGQELPNGASGRFTLQGVSDNFTPAAPVPSPGARVGFGPVPGALAFHAMLRARERALSLRPDAAWARRAPSALAVPPVLGGQRAFHVCKTTSCTSFVTVSATARYVGAKGAIFLDDTVPAGGYTQADLDSLGMLFDQHLYPIDTMAFGRESDLDGNGVVVVLLSDRINKLTPNCNQTNQVVLGYFFGLDLVADPNSNGGEVFYGLVPDPSNSGCTISKAFARNRIAPVFIHEFQHMISFNRHVLLGLGLGEETWLNEGLSHFAEELGGRQVPDAFCLSSNCLNEFAADNLRNAGDYLADPTATYLVEPGTSSGSLRERGANWLFVRWLADRSPTDSLLGTDLTRALDGADQAGGVALTGGANVAAAAAVFQPSVSFATLVGEWHLANYAEALSGFTEASGRLRYKSWDLAGAIDQLQPGPYPLQPDSTSGPGYLRTGTLRGGSGAYVRVVRPSGGPPVAVALSTGNAATVMPRLAVVRIR